MREPRTIYGVQTGRWYRCGGPRRVIAGESTTGRGGGFKVFTVWTRENNGEDPVAYDVWARDVVEAAQVISPRINQVEVVEKCK